MQLRRELHRHLARPVDSAPLGLFRIAFGLIMLAEVFFFFPLLGSILSPDHFHFTYPFASWVRPWPGSGMAVHLTLLGIASITLALGLFYRVSAIAVTLLFTHVFLIDRIVYNNHFYLYCLAGFMLIFLSGDAFASLDRRLRGKGDSKGAKVLIPAWQLWALRVQVIVVYFYGGIAKLNTDWLAGEPVREWLRSLHDAPVIGGLAAMDGFVLFIAWSGMLFDLVIGFLLCWRRTFVPAAIATIAFHCFNMFWLSIGTFPIFGILSLILFVPPEKARAVSDRFAKLFQRSPAGESEQPHSVTWGAPRAVAALIAVFVAIQIALPLRVHLYAGNPSWHECGHSFSWRMMLRKKLIGFHLDAGPGGEEALARHGLILSFDQQAAMAKDPNLLHCYAQRAAAALRAEGIEHPVIRVKALVSLNGRPFRHLVDPEANLAEAQNPWLGVPSWVLPLEEELPIGKYPRTAEEQSAMIQDALARYRPAALAGQPAPAE